MSRSSSTYSPYSADEPRNPPSSEPEEDPSMDTDSGNEVSSERVVHNSPRVIPVAQPQPPRSGPRIIVTPRKRVPIPTRMSMGIIGPTTSQTPQMPMRTPVTGTPVLTAEMTHQIYRTSAEVRDCHARLSHQQQHLEEMSELLIQLIQRDTQTRETVSTAGRDAKGSMFLSQLLLGLVLILVVPLILVLWFQRRH